MSQPSNVPARETHGNQDFSQIILRRYPVLWQGQLTLKSAQALVQMHFVSGNPSIARAALPRIINGEAQPVRIAQRMRLDQAQLDGVFNKMQLVEEHCVLMALPCGKDHRDLVQQANNLKLHFISYFLSKGAAGIVNALVTGTEIPAFVIHVFPSCDFTHHNVGRIAPSLLHFVSEISHLVIIIGTV